MIQYNKVNFCLKLLFLDFGIIELYSIISNISILRIVLAMYRGEIIFSLASPIESEIRDSYNSLFTSVSDYTYY